METLLFELAWHAHFCCCIIVSCSVIKIDYTLLQDVTRTQLNIHRRTTGAKCLLIYCCEVNQRLTENVVATRRIAAHRHDVGVISSDHDQRVVIVSQRNSSFDSLVERDHLFQCVLGLRHVMAVIYASTCTHPSAVINQHKLHVTSISRAFLENDLNVLFFVLTSWNVPISWYGNTDTRYYRFHISDN